MKNTIGFCITLFFVLTTVACGGAEHQQTKNEQSKTVTVTNVCHYTVNENDQWVHLRINNTIDHDVPVDVGVTVGTENQSLQQRATKTVDANGEWSGDVEWYGMNGAITVTVRAFETDQWVDAATVVAVTDCP